MNDHHQTTTRRLADNPVAIVGMSSLFPMARNLGEFWQNIVGAADCTSEVPGTHWNIDDYYDADPAVPDKTYCRRGGFVPEVPFSVTEFGLPPNQLEVTTVVQLLSLLVARDVLADAGAPGADWYRPERTGVVLGVAGPTTLSHPLAARLSTPVLKEVVRSCGLTQADAEQIAEKYAAAFAPWEENSFPGLLGNVIAGRVANRLDLGGMNCTIDAACASSLSAVHVAIGELVSGRSDLMITGGCDTENSIFGYMCFSKVGALSKSGQIKPLDDSADGTLVGEGVGMLALKRLADAQRDGDRVYAVIRGIGSSSDGRFKSIYAPRAEGQQAALHRAYEDADCSPSSIGLFEAHATGTRVGDATELEALTSVLRESTEENGYAAIGSVKSQIGHTKGAAGAASLIKLAMSLYHKVLPPTINVTKPNRALGEDSPFYINTRTRPWILDPHRPRRRAAASAMGFGGTNFHAVLEETSSDRAELRTMHRTAQVHLWHAADARELAGLVRSSAPADDAEIPADHARVGFVARDEQEAAALRELAAGEVESHVDEPEWSHPKGIFYRRHALADLKVGALFAGQGSQYVDMGLATVLNNPTVAGAFDEANAVFADSPRPLAPVVFPPPVFDPEERNEQENVLRRTEYAQPAIGALAAGQYRFLAERGLECGGFLGHSFGELTALWAAGSLDDADFFALAKARGEAMALSGDGDPGTMAAVQASREDVAEILRDHPEVSICNHNAPTQIVVGGGSPAVAALVSACRERGLTVRELPVAAAFHTKYVAHAVEPFREAVKAVSIRAPKTKVYANSEGAEYGSRVATNRRVLAEQLLKPVEFVAGLQAMHADGCRVFVEFGPKGVLTQLVQRTLGEDVVAIATDAGPTGDGDVALKKAALRLAVLGVPLRAVHRHDAPAVVEAEPQGMVVRLTGRDYVPDSRRQAYQTGLSEKVELEAVAAARAAGAASVPAAPAAPAVVPAPVAAPVAPLVPVAAPAPVAAVAPVAAPVVHSGPGVDAVAQQHLELHSHYAEGQLRVAEDLVSVLREAQRTGGVDDRLYATVDAVKEHSLALGQTHTRVNEILASLTTLEFGGAPVPTTTNGTGDHGAGDNGAAGNGHHPVAYAEPADLPALPDPVIPQQLDASPEPPSMNGTPAPAGVDVQSVLVEVVSEKTGYPPEMLDLSMDLEADLGVDSIKRVQILGALKDRVPSVPAVGPEQVAELRTLNDIVAFVGTPAPASAPAGVDVQSVLVEVVSEKTGYPPEMLDLSMDLEADLGVDSIKRVQILGALKDRVPGVPAVGPEQVAELRTLNDIVAFVGAPAPAGVDVQSVLVEVVSEKTGYPPEMLDLSMDLEADLGVDSIKRVQILGALKDRVPGVPAVGPEQVAELRTLNDIVSFVGAPAPAPAGADVRSVLVEVVSEKTGYPPEMLDLSMDLEADLGVDSIKRVQILGALKDRVEGVPAVGPEQVAELRTLNDIVAFVGAPAETAPSGADVRSVLVDIVSEKTGYPPEMLDLSMDLEADLGVDSIKRVQILGALKDRVEGVPAVGPEQVAELRTLNDIVAFVGAPAETVEPSTSDTLAPAAEQQPVLLRIEQVRLPAVDRLDEPYATGKTALVIDHGEPAAEVLATALEQRGWTVHRADAGGQEDAALSTWDGDRIEHTVGKALEPATRLDLCLTVLPADGQWQAGARRLADTILTAKLVHDRLTATTGSRAAFVTVTRIDGALGHRGDRPAAASLIGGVAGLTKTLAQEAPALFCRALDLAPELTDEALTEAVLDELADAATDAREVAIDADRTRWTIRPRPIGEPADPAAEPAITTDDVLVVTGGARGVTAHCVKELATRRPCEFLLLGRTELTDEPAWATGVADGALKPAAIAALRGEKPKQIDRVTRDLLAQREIRATVEEIAATGARVHYVAVDVTDAEATKAALAPYHQRVTGIVHGAGALADALLPAKTPADIRTVLATKVDGLHNVVAALAEAELRHVILFGSVAGVLGNPGQADYAVANEALNRVGISWKRQRPASQVTTINWGAWDGGMVTPELREVFLSRGVALLGMDAGARLFAEQLTPARADDVSVLAGPPNPLAPPAIPARTPAFKAHRDLAGLAADPVIFDHQVGRFPVFPAAAGLGWAINVLERANPGLRVVEVSGFEVLKGIVYDGGHERDYWLDVEAGVLDGDRLTVKAWIRSAEPGKTLPPSHFAGTFVLAAGPAAAPTGTAYALGAGEEDGLEVYRSATLFHGPLLQGIRRILRREERHFVAECRLPDTPLGHGEFAGGLHSPVLSDVVIQAGSLLGVWFMASGCLPLTVGRIEYFAPLPGDRPFVAEVGDLRANSDRTQVTVTVTASDPDGRVLQRYTDLSVIATPEMTAKFAEAVRLREENR
ncbi:type I polyketide synthase [Amycolatopsis sp. GM8]|uniref:type I polyketide synthase n=1 Tax=Amycolatopsis sp. GM8 TaxID=2896530 RepID=UPI001F161708|nr:type I polyketide synthase [Amycolatopsis sp. GM8]